MDESFLLTPGSIDATPLQARVSKYHDVDTSDADGLGFWDSVGTHLNFIMGSGLLAIAYSFGQGGIGLGSILLILFTGVALGTCVYMLEALACAEALVRRKLLLAPGPHAIESGILPRHGMSAGEAMQVRSDRAHSAADLKQQPSSAAAMALNATLSHAEQQDVSRPHMRLSARKFETTELCELFLGKWGQRAYLVAVCLYLTFVVWSYGAVFANSFSENIPLPGLSKGSNSSYLVWLALYALITVIIAAFEVKEQRRVQQVMAVARFALMSSSAITLIAALAGGPGGFPAADNVHEPLSPQGTQWSFAQIMFGAEGAVTRTSIARMLPILVFSQLFVVAAPVLAQAVRDKDRLRTVYTATYSLTTTLYIAVGIPAVLMLGSLVKSSLNLNYDDYGEPHGSPAVQQAIAWFIVLFPAFDAANVAPLNIICLASNCMAGWYGSKNVARMEAKHRYRVIGLRVLCLVPAVVGAAFVHDLGVVLQWTGLIGVTISFVFPAVLWLAARAAVIREFMLTPIEASTALQTVYTGWWCTVFWAKGVILFGVVVALTLLGLLIADA